MDSTALVDEAHQLIRLMDEAGCPPKGAMLVRNPETDSWRLWIIPPDNLLDKRDFYGKVATLIVDRQDDFSLLDAGNVDLRSADHPAIQGLSRFIRADGLNSIHLSGNSFNGFYLPEGILLRMAL